MSACLCVLDSVVPSHSSQAAGANISARDFGNEAGTLPGMYGVEADASNDADNATYCRGIEPITIEPMDCESDSNDVEPLSYDRADIGNTSATHAIRQNDPDVVMRPGADVMTPPAMRVVYCGTVSGDQLLGQAALRGVAGNLMGSAPSPNVPTADPRGRNLSVHDGTVGNPVSVDCVPKPADVGSSSSTNSSRTTAAIQRRNADTSTPSHATQQLPSSSHQPTVSSSESGLGTGTGRKNTSACKSRRAKSLDGESSTARHRSVMLSVC